MAINSTLLTSLALLTATYLLHSTLLLCGAWLTLRLCRVYDHALAERAWKLAAVLGLLTAPLQSATGAAQGTSVFVLEGPATPWLRPSVEIVGDENCEPKPSGVASIPLWRDLDDAVVGDTIAASPYTMSREHATISPRSVDSGAQTGEGELPNGPSGAQAKTSIAPPPLAPATAFTISRLLAVAGALIAGWMALAAAWLVARACWFGRQSNSARCLENGPARKELDRLRHKSGVRRRVRLLESPLCATPVAFGLWRWTILVPAGVEQRLRYDELGALLAHELAHLARGDVVWLWIGRVLATCLAFQPLNRLACRRWRRASEYLCDEWAVEQLVSPLALARCLTQIAGWRLDRRQIADALPAVGTPGALVERVERLLAGDPLRDPWTTTLRRIGIAVAAVVITAVFTFWAPQVARSKQPSTAADDGAVLDGIEPAANTTTSFDVSRTTGATPIAWHELQTDWRNLSAELRRAETLLSSSAQDIEVRSLAEQVRKRAAAIERRIESVRFQSNLTISFTEE